jgi:hypothetical protein
MPKSKSKIPESLLILFSYAEKVGETAIHLSYRARRAYTERDFSRLADYSKSLINLSPFEEVGEYYQALTLSQHGAGDIENSQSTFHKLTESPIIQLRAASTLTLGMQEIRRNNYTEAERLIFKATQLALSDSICAPLTLINAHNGLSIIRGIEGDSKESLKVLSAVEPLVKAIGSFYPAMLGQDLNSRAYEHLQLGALEAASHLINKALAIKSVTPFTEWLETKQEIDSAINAAKFSQIFIPRLRNVDNVAHVNFTSLSRIDSKLGEVGKLLHHPGWATNWLEIHLRIDDVMHLYETVSLPPTRQIAAKLLSNLLTGIADLSCPEGSVELTVETYICSKQASVLLSEDGLLADSVDELNDLIYRISNLFIAQN